MAALLCEIFGNLFRPVSADPSWRVWERGTAMQLARGFYDDRRFGDLPILADALEEAGCTEASILQHCRGKGPHIRRCWCVSLLLSRS